jgi:DnaK suppressor protein
MAKAKKVAKPAPKKAAKPVKTKAKSAPKGKGHTVAKSKAAPRISASKSKPAAKASAKSAVKKVATWGKADLEFFRQNIAHQLEDAREELGNLTEHLMDSVSGEYEEENSVYSLHMADQGTDAMEREKDFLQAQRLNDYIKKLDEAMKRIEDATYGACVVCGKLIEKQRLVAVPVTQKHVDCKNKEAASAPKASSREDAPLHHFPEMN